MSDFVPAEVFPPGEFLRDELDARGWTQSEFAEIIGRPVRLVNEVLSGKRSVTPETARAFAAALGTSAQFWLNLETSYQLSRAAPASDQIARAARLRERFPVREMIKRSWIEHSENLDVLEQRVLDFFGIGGVEDAVAFSHAARKTVKEQCADIQLAWLFRVRQLAMALDVSAYSPDKLAATLVELEALMEEPETISRVPGLLSEAGVRFVIVEPVPGSQIEGVCFWIDDNRSPVVGLSLRFGRIDNFWFNLRHELEHVLRGDGKTGVIVDDGAILSGQGQDSDQERRANAAAADFCVPSSELNDFIARMGPSYSTKAILDFSKSVRRHPGIVAGQVQKRTGNWKLFRKYQVDIRPILTSAALTDGHGHAAPPAM
jgi:HTH-type transcriptional regulator/antitoxin HigA